MKADAAAERLPISRLAVKASCPLCAAVKYFQEMLAGNLRAEGQSQEAACRGARRSFSLLKGESLD